MASLMPLGRTFDGFVEHAKQFPARLRSMQREEMLQAEEVAAMMRLHDLGWGAKRLSKEFG